ncbi:MAG: GFA family protein [Colwellia sp.]|nr:GFA family protein [Colwellia sp.]MCW8866606.1 GFA family protein [Colwellia sp.]MCW9082731.1 GFA family protein [Colwellia sp.]
MKNIGSCLCKQVTFEVTKFQGPIGHCHCTMCQKFHGAAFSTFVEARKADLHWLSGKALLKTYQAENDSIRTFCGCCGSSLLFESTHNRHGQTIEIALAAFDTLEALHVDAHIYTDSKASWYEINDTLPQFPQYRSK